jgi:hypothetical protein
VCLFSARPRHLLVRHRHQPIRWVLVVCDTCVPLLSFNYLFIIFIAHLKISSVFYLFNFFFSWISKGNRFNIILVVKSYFKKICNIERATITTTTTGRCSDTIFWIELKAVQLWTQPTNQPKTTQKDIVKKKNLFLLKTNPFSWSLMETHFLYSSHLRFYYVSRVLNLLFILTVHLILIWEFSGMSSCLLPFNRLVDVCYFKMSSVTVATEKNASQVSLSLNDWIKCSEAKAGSRLKDDRLIM